MITKYKVIFFDLGDTLVKDKKWLPDAKELLKRLSMDEIPLGIISNTGDFNREDLLSVLPADFSWNLFKSDLIILSSEVNIEKPSLEIFRLAREKSGCEPAKCLFCTENVVDGLVAQQVGLHSYRVQPPPDSDIGKVYLNLSTIQV